MRTTALLAASCLALLLIVPVVAQAAPEEDRCLIEPIPPGCPPHSLVWVAGVSVCGTPVGPFCVLP